MAAAKRAVAKATLKPTMKATPKSSMKATPKATVTTTTKKTLVGPAAVAELKKQVSPSGMKQAEAKQKLAIVKKYPGLYKKSK